MGWVPGVWPAAHFLEVGGDEATVLVDRDLLKEPQASRRRGSAQFFGGLRAEKGGIHRADRGEVASICCTSGCGRRPRIRRRALVPDDRPHEHFEARSITYLPVTRELLKTVRMHEGAGRKLRVGQLEQRKQRGGVRHMRKNFCVSGSVSAGGEVAISPSMRTS